MSEKAVLDFFFSSLNPEQRYFLACTGYAVWTRYHAFLIAFPPSTVISKLLSFPDSNFDSCACSYSFKFAFGAFPGGCLNWTKIGFLSFSIEFKIERTVVFLLLRCLLMLYRSWAAFMYTVVNLQHSIKSKELLPLKGGRRPSGFGGFCLSLTQLPRWKGKKNLL